MPPSVPNTDGHYFVNCKASDGTLSSGVAYYEDLNPGQNVGQQPDAYVEVSHGNYYDWEKTGSGERHHTSSSYTSRLI